MSDRSVIGRHSDQSTPFWPAEPKAPAGAPNVMFIVFDDVGFSDFGCFGSEVSTPNLDRLAAGGLRYTNFHTTALCSPTRACLLTGRNHHHVGMGGLADWDFGYPGYRGRISPSAGTLAEILRPEGYNTFALGKWHLTPVADTGYAGPYDGWPTQRGFDRYYGFLEGETNQWQPEMTEDNHHIDPPTDPEYHLTPDLVDRAIEMVRSQTSASADKPFFLYLAFGACHAPHHVPASYIDRYVPVFEKGWDRTREDRLARQKTMGVVPAHTELPPRNPTVRPWDDVPDNEKRVAVRLQSAFAGMLEHTDEHIGRLLDFLAHVGRLDNTMVCVISDNGASQEGSPFGTVNAMRFFNGVRDDPAFNDAHAHRIGEREVNNNYNHGWAMAGNTPLKRYKQNTHGGGIRDPLIIHWPQGIAARGEVRHQFHHVSDLTPTVLEVLGLQLPAHIKGAPQMPLDGTSLAYSFAPEHRDTPTRKHVQYFEMLGHRGIWHDGWKAVTFHDPRTRFDDDQWELYHVAEDFNERHDLAAERPDKLKEMVELWWSEAGRNQVLPLQGAGRLFASRRPDEPRSHRFHQGYINVPNRAAPDIRNRSYSVAATVQIPDGGAEGALVAHGDWNSGYGLYVKDGHLVHDYNFVGTHYVVRSTESLTPGPHTLEFHFTKTGDHAGMGQLRIDGRPCGEIAMARTLRGLLSMSGFDVGRDSHVPVGPYDPPFAFTGTIDLVEFALGDDQDIDLAAETAAQLARQ